MNLDHLSPKHVEVEFRGDTFRLRKITIEEQLEAAVGLGAGRRPTVDWDKLEDAKPAARKRAMEKLKEQLRFDLRRDCFPTDEDVERFWENVTQETNGFPPMNFTEIQKTIRRLAELALGINTGGEQDPKEQDS